MTVGEQRRAALGGAPVLPDDGGSDGLPRAPIPHHGGFALVGDADRRKVAGCDARLARASVMVAAWVDQIWTRVVLHPARMRIRLRMFALPEPAIRRS